MHNSFPTPPPIIPDLGGFSLLVPISLNNDYLLQAHTYQCCVFIHLRFIRFTKKTLLRAKKDFHNYLKMVRIPAVFSWHDKTISSNQRKFLLLAGFLPAYETPDLELFSFCNPWSTQNPL